MPRTLRSGYCKNQREENVRESDDAEIDESTQCEHCSGIVEHFRLESGQWVSSSGSSLFTPQCKESPVSENCGRRKKIGHHQREVFMMTDEECRTSLPRDFVNL